LAAAGVPALVAAEKARRAAEFPAMIAARDLLYSRA
jgi:hypothetical protein